MADIDHAGLLRVRLAMAEADLARAKAALQAPQIHARFQSTVWNRFNPRLSDLERRLQEIRNGLANDAFPRPLWSNLTTVTRDARAVLRECLAFLEGVLVRSVGLDGGICDLADALLRGLSHNTRVPWSELTILAEEESIVQTAEIIRVRFPEFSVWALPVVAHEFGHLVARTYSSNDGKGGRQQFPFMDLLQQAGPEERQAHELFADFFGLWALGPALACTAILLRLDPAEQETTDRADHPPSGRRVAFLLATLDRLNELDGPFDRPYDAVIDLLGRAWAAAHAVFEGSSELPDLTPLDQRRLNQFLQHATRLRDARYTGWTRALGLKGALTNDLPAVPAVQGYSIVDVINAAWWTRMEAWNDSHFDVARLEQRAFQLCTAAVGLRAPAEGGGS